MRPFPTLALFIIIGIFGPIHSQASDAIAWPIRPIKVIVPFGAGGGSDTFARQLIRVIESQQLLPQPFVVINVGGAGGSVGSRRVRNARPDGYTMLMLHDGMLTARYAGKTPYGPEAFEAIAGTGLIGLVITVKDDSPVKNLTQLMEQAAEQPKSINFAANIGAPTHFIGLMVEKSLPGALFNFVQYGGGADRYGAIVGGHVQLSIFSVEEYLRYKEGGLRALAVFSPERHPAVPLLPTAIEQGFKVNTTNMHFWWMPKGTPKYIQEIMADAIEMAMASKPMRSFLKQSWTEPIVLRGESLKRELKERDERVSKVSLRKTDVLPNFPLWIAGITGVLMLVALVLNRNKVNAAAPPAPLWNPRSLFCYALTFIYVLCLSLELASYPILTSFYIFILGSAIATNRKKALIPLLSFALILSVGLFYLFTQVLVVDLPG